MLIKEFCKVLNGATPSTTNSSYWNGDIIWLTPDDLSEQNTRYIFRGNRNISKKGLESCSTTLLPVGTILLTSRAPIGYISIAAEELCTNQGFKSLICNNELANNLYLYYWLLSHVNYLKQIAGGSTFKELSKEVLLSVDVPLPSLDKQQHIVDTIGSVDDLIEKYEEINEQIDKYCDLTIKRETRHLSTCPVGDLNYIRIINSGIKKFTGKKVYLDTSSVQDNQIIDESYKITYENRPSRANMQPIPSSVWFAKMKNSPKFILVKSQSKDLLDNFIFSTGYLGLVADEHTVNYLYFVIKSEDFTKQKDLNANGSTMQAINNDSFNKILVPNTSHDVALEIGRKIGPFVDILIKNQKNIRLLKQVKDLLLQKYFN